MVPAGSNAASRATLSAPGGAGRIADVPRQRVRLERQRGPPTEAAREVRLTRIPEQTLQLASAGSPVHPSVTVPANAPRLLTVRFIASMACPSAAVMLVAAAARAKVVRSHRQRQRIGRSSALPAAKSAVPAIRRPGCGGPPTGIGAIVSAARAPSRRVWPYRAATGPRTRGLSSKNCTKPVGAEAASGAFTAAASAIGWVSVALDGVSEKASRVAAGWEAAKAGCS